MSGLELFTNGEFEVEVQRHPEDGFRVMAPGLARALGFSGAREMIRNVPDGEKGVALEPTPGGDQQVSYLTQAGFYRVVGQRQAGRIKNVETREKVKRFQTWAFADLIPTVMNTGSYSLPGVIPQQRQAPDHALPGSYLEALRELVVTVERAEVAETRVAELEPAAAAWHGLTQAEGAVNITEAAKILQSHGIKTSAGKLHGQLEALDWIHRWYNPDGSQHGQWKAKTKPVRDGHLVSVIKSYDNRKTSEPVLYAQIQVTATGLDRLRILLGGNGPTRAIGGGA